MSMREVGETGRLILDQPFLKGLIPQSELSCIFSDDDYDLLCGDQEAGWCAARRDGGWDIARWNRSRPFIEMTTTSTRLVALDLARTTTERLKLSEFVPARLPVFLPRGVTAELTGARGMTIRWVDGEATAFDGWVTRLLDLAQLVVTSDKDLRASLVSPTGAPALRPVEEARAEYERLGVPKDVHYSYSAWIDWYWKRTGRAEGEASRRAPAPPLTRETKQ